MQPTLPQRRSHCKSTSTCKKGRAALRFDSFLLAALPRAPGPKADICQLHPPPESPATSPAPPHHASTRNGDPSRASAASASDPIGPKVRASQRQAHAFERPAGQGRSWDSHFQLLNMGWPDPRENISKSLWNRARRGKGDPAHSASSENPPKIDTNH